MDTRAVPAAPATTPARKPVPVRLLATLGMFIGFAGGLMLSMHGEQTRMAKLDNAHVAKAEPIVKSATKSVDSGDISGYVPMVAED